MTAAEPATDPAGRTSGGRYVVLSWAIRKADRRPDPSPDPNAGGGLTMLGSELDPLAPEQEGQASYTRTGRTYFRFTDPNEARGDEPPVWLSDLAALPMSHPVGFDRPSGTPFRLLSAVWTVRGGDGPDLVFRGGRWAPTR